MPVTLMIVIAFYLFAMLIDGSTVVMNGPNAISIARLVLGAVVVALLLRGNEGMRMVVRFSAVVGVLMSMVVLLQAWQIGIEQDLGLVAFVAGVVALVGNAVTFWSLGREDVQAWMTTRMLQRIDQT